MNGGGGMPDPLKVHTPKSRGGMGLPDPLHLFDSQEDPPPGPDYLGAATEQGRQNRLTAELNARLNNPNVSTPFGGQTVTFQNGVPNITQTLSPFGDAKLKEAEASMSAPFSFGGVDDVQNKVEQAILSRLEPQFTRDEDALRTRLANQGITASSSPEAFGKDFEKLTQARNDARMQAVLTGVQARPQALNEALMIRGLPMQELNAIRGGTTFPGYTGANAAPAPTLDATKAASDYEADLFNQNQASQGQQTQMLGSLAVAAAMFF